MQRDTEMVRVNVRTMQRDTEMMRVVMLNEEHVRVVDQKDRRIRELEQALADSQRELDDAKRRRVE